MDIYAKIERLKYSPLLLPELKECSMEDLEGGKMGGIASFILNYENNRFGVSQWVSPKRTRSYPYVRVYDTMSLKNKITLIPFLKDEGLDGDRDFVQWDTVSLMSLLNVYVILGYYSYAIKSKKYKNKITSQRLDYLYIRQQIDKLLNYQSSPLHWNLDQLENLKEITDISKQNYKRISDECNVQMHSEDGLDKRIEIIQGNVNRFRELSRKSASEAQHREIQTIQPKENTVLEKASITIENYQGGQYFFTADEICISDDKLFIIEKKHSKKDKIPSLNDIKDGFVKMMLFTNLSKAKILNKEFVPVPVIGLTSEKFQGYCHSRMSEEDILKVLNNNNFNSNQINKINSIFKEGITNNFVILLMESGNEEFQRNILKSVY